MAMSALEVYAQRCSISYAEMRPERLAAIILGSSRKDSEIASLEQGLLETAPDAKNHSLADELAAELGITRDALESRCLELCGEELGSSSTFHRHLPPTFTPDYWRDAPEVSSWAYRVMRRRMEGGSSRLAIHEVFFGYRGEVVTWTASQLAPQADEDAGDDMNLVAEFEFMQQALSLPILDFETGEEVAPPLVVVQRKEAPQAH